ncbi:hypothetical protein DET57_101419 [Klebsiella oxytoca]|uniref:Uncharacterized protein n=1 Tax=Klebsiella oxytoca TaxID=571 RepID=A0A318G1W9_KLEOX|nr:hypothetical protein DET57_101419 [Klebsiella oxytoca]
MGNPHLRVSAASGKIPRLALRSAGLLNEVGFVARVRR